MKDDYFVILRGIFHDANMLSYILREKTICGAAKVQADRAETVRLEYLCTMKKGRPRF
jgi:hypothetical protein